jgi:hypothetical protein
MRYLIDFNNQGEGTRMASFYRAAVERFLSSTSEEILAQLSVEYAGRGYTRQYSDQTLTWKRDIDSLRCALKRCVTELVSAKSWGLLLEFSIPRKELRIDAVLLVRDAIVILEAKSGQLSLQNRRQLEEYALLLHYFHQASANHRICPILVSPQAADSDLSRLRQQELFPQLASFWITPVIESCWDGLSAVLLELEKHGVGALSTDTDTWDSSPYFPVPTILEAAVSLRSGLSIREIAHSEAAETEIETVLQAISGYMQLARREQRHAICFLTGVPGSGKTLVGLSLAHSDYSKKDPIHFMSGNGPLVKVLQHLFTLEGRQEGSTAVEAKAQAKTLIENVHVFARYYTDDNLASPSNHAVIFDEAQRAWNRHQNKKKFGRDYSEPEMLLRIMERHSDWALIVALVGGGQEINDGEAGLEEWGRALTSASKDWMVYASAEVLEGGPSTAGHRLFEKDADQYRVNTSTSLHLRTSQRSLRAENLATWVNLVLDGACEQAALLRTAAKFPIFLSRNLDQVRRELRRNAIGTSRCGLAGSSGAARLRAEGLEPSSSFHADYPWEHWYLAEETDVRSSYRCEVFATEFEIQGLELDWIGLCWGGDFVWDDHTGWQPRSLRHGRFSRWISIKSPDKRMYRKNAYRVLLTRARQGLVIYVPAGDKNDSTHMPEDFDNTAQYLMRCGVVPLP